MKLSGWEYYLPEQGETADDARSINIYDWQNVYNAEDAAEHASKDEWDNRDRWDGGIGEGPPICVISPDGSETTFETYREATIEHTVEEREPQ